MYNSVPTSTFNIESIVYRSVTFDVWDVGGHGTLRLLWPQYFDEISAIVWVVDSSQADRLEESCNELHTILNHDELEEDTPLFVFANK